MPTVLYAWELGANLGHLIPLSGIQNNLGEDRHRAVFAVADIGIAAASLPATTVMLQAPVWPRHRHFGAHGAGFASYADLLAAIGFGDPQKLAAMIGAWSRLVDLVKPHVVVADHAPGLLAALNGRGVPVVAVGSGFTMPPVDRDQFPPLRGDRGPAIPETRLFQALRSAEESCGRTPSPHLLAPFRTAGRVVFGLPELDPYRSFRTEAVAAPPGGLPAAQPWPTERRLFVYVGGDARAFDVLAQALSLLQIPVEAFFRGDRGPVPKFLRLRGIKVHETPPPLREVLSRASHVLTEGGAMTSAAAFAAGRPQLVLPPHEEAELNLSLLEQHGVAARLEASEDPRTMAAAIEAFVADPAPQERAQEIARRLADRPLPDGGAVAAAAIRAALG